MYYILIHFVAEENGAEVVRLNDFYDDIDVAVKQTHKLIGNTVGYPAYVQVRSTLTSSIAYEQFGYVAA